MTKIIYINWDTHEIVTNTEEKEQWIDAWICDNCFLYGFSGWLDAYYEVIEIYHMTAAEKAQLSVYYEEYLKSEKENYADKAEKVFNEDFDEIGIEVNGYAD